MNVQLKSPKNYAKATAQVCTLALSEWNNNFVLANIIEIIGKLAPEVNIALAIDCP